MPLPMQVSMAFPGQDTGLGHDVNDAARNGITEWNKLQKHGKERNVRRHFTVGKGLFSDGATNNGEEGLLNSAVTSPHTSASLRAQT